jgi:hypothetical protein
MRRFTRLTNAFSKKVENHAAVALLHASLPDERIHHATGDHLRSANGES